MPVFSFETFSTRLNTSSIIHMTYMSFQKVSRLFTADHDLSLKMCARNKGNKWYSSSSKGQFHRKYRTFWSHVIHSSVTDPVQSISGKGWQALHLCCNFERLLLKIIAVSRRTKRFSLFLCQIDYLCPPYFVFVNGNNVLYLCFYKQIWTMKYMAVWK